MKHYFLSLFLLITAFFVDSTHAGVLRFDVDALDASASETQAGFTRMADPNVLGDFANGVISPTGTAGGVTVTATTLGSNGSGFRDRGIGNANNPPGPYQNLLRDFISSNPAGDAEIRVTIQNLLPGSYQISTFHHDWHVAHRLNPFDILATDALGTDQLKVDNADWQSGGQYFGETFFVTSDGSDITLRVIDQGTFNGVRFNGLTISSVPEPGALAIWSLSACVLVGTRKRRPGASSRMKRGG